MFFGKLYNLLQQPEFEMGDVFPGSEMLHKIATHEANFHGKCSNSVLDIQYLWHSSHLSY